MAQNIAIRRSTRIHSPVAEVVILVEAPEAEAGDDVWASETAPLVAADAFEDPSALAVELAVAVMPAEAGHDAAEGSFTLTVSQSCTATLRVSVAA